MQGNKKKWQTIFFLLADLSKPQHWHWFGTLGMRIENIVVFSVVFHMRRLVNKILIKFSEKKQIERDIFCTFFTFFTGLFCYLLVVLFYEWFVARLFYIIDMNCWMTTVPLSAVHKMDNSIWFPFHSKFSYLIEKFDQWLLFTNRKKVNTFGKRLFILQHLRQFYKCEYCQHRNYQHSVSRTTMKKKWHSMAWKTNEKKEVEIKITIKQG